MIEVADVPDVDRRVGKEEVVEIDEIVVGHAGDVIDDEPVRLGLLVGAARSLCDG